jgi:lysophospholipase L1-like esterase
VNNFIKSSEQSLFCVDVESKIPYLRKGENLLWDDSLHFSAAGYDRLGEVIFEAIENHFSKL